MLLLGQIIGTVAFVTCCYMKANYKLASDLELTIELLERKEKEEAA